MRLDPFEKMNIGDSMYAARDWWTFEFWRFVFVQQEVAKLGETAVEFPPMQPGASFNLEAVKDQVKQAISSLPADQARGQEKRTSGITLLACGAGGQADADAASIDVNELFRDRDDDGDGPAGRLIRRSR